MITAAFDPGGTTGWVIFKDDQVIAQGQTKFLELLPELDGLPKPDQVVYEDFQLYSHKAKAQIGSKFETVQAIGMIKSYAHKHKAKVYTQPANIMPIAEKWTGVKRPKQHNIGHWVCAYLHGSYHLIKNGMKETRLEKQGGNP